MNKNIFKINLMVILFISLFIFSGITSAGVVEDIKSEVPASWFEAPKTASKLGISDFTQSPILDQEVENGDIPEVRERLPENPPVLEPLSEIGDYGGTHVLKTDALDILSYDIQKVVYPQLFKPDPLGRKLLPALAQDYSFNEDYTVFTLKLRKGLKWSDGEAFNADDFVYWWKAEASNEDLNPIQPEDWKPVGWKSLEKVNDNTIKITFNSSNPLFMKNIWNRFMNANWAKGVPSHFLKQFHPEYTNKPERLQQLIKKEGFDEWYQFYEFVKQDGRNQTEYRMPTLGAYTVKQSSSNSLLLKRNPYFPFVDSSGNQLPYIDKMKVELVQDWDVYNAQAATGEITLGMERVSFQDAPLYKNYSKKENFKLNMGQRIHSAQVYFMPNLNHKNENIREVLKKADFRRALSLAINREEINRTFYFNMAEPSALTVHPTSPYYKDSYQKYIDFNPEKARKLLDNIGLVDRNGDGLRDLPNGETFNITIEAFPYRKVVPKIIQMVISHWKQVGLDVDLKTVDFGLLNTHIQANEHDMTVFAAWTLGGLLFPANLTPSSHFVPVQSNHNAGAQWPLWSRWYQTKDTEEPEGKKPPTEIMNLINWYEEAITTTETDRRKELIENILEVNAEKVWNIGTVGRWKALRISNQNLKNMPGNFIMGAVTNSGYGAYHPNTWYFEGGSAAE